MVRSAIPAKKLHSINPIDRLLFESIEEVAIFENDVFYQIGDDSLVLGIRLFFLSHILLVGVGEGEVVEDALDHVLQLRPRQSPRRKVGLEGFVDAQLLYQLIVYKLLVGIEFGESRHIFQLGGLLLTVAIIGYFNAQLQQVEVQVV